MSVNLRSACYQSRLAFQGEKLLHGSHCIDLQFMQ